MTYHFKKYSVDPGKSGASWILRFPAHGTGPEVVMEIPRSGVFDDPRITEELGQAQVERLAHAIAAILDAVLDMPDMTVPKP